MINKQERTEEVARYYEAITNTNSEYVKYWFENIYGHWDYWIVVLLTISPWIIWFLVRNKQSQGRLLMAGLLMMLFASSLDFLGVVSGRWFYTTDVIPTLPSFLPWDVSIFPVLIMLFIQFKPELNPWLKALVFSLFNSFVGEPFMKWLGLYVSVITASEMYHQ
ncbi:CBO0543 family protein [Alkalihalobacillus sp. MEB130]|uniref:CBO0543 family protein n=1 Tax=Alkalihalobacillus sp. MEB130 TaxID=2976704 RepID=UPI0028EFE045|nr:CBO0543 family protein [Alkalihalobacillus sp. MEB130]